MVAIVSCLLFFIAAAAMAALWARERQAFRAERLASGEARSALVTIEQRFKPVLDLDAEARRLTVEHSRIREQIETDAKHQLEQRLAIDADAQHRRDEFAREISALKRGADEQRSQQEAQIQQRREIWEAQFANAMAALEELHKEVEGLNEEAEIQSFGLYKPRYQFASSAEFRRRLDQVREQQKEMVKSKTAAVCSTTWQVSGSAVEGRKMTARQLKLMLRAFNGECDGAIASVSWKNVVTLHERIRKSFEGINKLGETVQCEIVRAYLTLKEDELALAHECAEKLHEEREEQRHLREQMRDEEKANRELERDRDEAEREEERYQDALARARAESEKGNEKQRTVLDAKIAKLEGLLAVAEARRQRAVSQAELTRTGHVYILSNEGSLGSNVFKIGMTRRLDPLDRVYELGGAPVPFHFDVHALIRSDDAPALESKLHAALEPHRVNLVNRRKEFFRVPIEKVVDLVTTHHGQIEFTQAAEASDYRKTLAIRAEREAMIAGKEMQASAVKRVDELRARFDVLKKATA
jgi:DNA repair exonuclease SbcCD ATPase subunit